MNFTDLGQYLTGKKKTVWNTTDVEMISKLVENFDGFETAAIYSPGGVSFSTFGWFSTPFLCSPQWNAGGSVMDEISVGHFRSTEAYSVKDQFILRKFGDGMVKKVVDRTGSTDVVAITGKGVVFYAVMWDGTEAGVPVISVGFELLSASPFLEETPNERKTILCYTELDDDGNLMYIRQTQNGPIDMVFHECCPPGPTPGTCPEDCQFCEDTGPVTVVVAGFVSGLCSELNNTFPIDTNGAQVAPACYHAPDGPFAPTCTTGRTCDDQPLLRAGGFAGGGGDPSAGAAVCCNGLWNLSVYYADQRCEGFRTARFFGSPDEDNNNCIPLTALWQLEGTPDMGVCQNPLCTTCIDCCDADCEQCTSGGTMVTS